MSEMRQQAPTTGATSAPQVPRQRSDLGPREATRWVGMVLFGAVMLVLAGIFQIIAGLAALFDDGYYLVSSNGLLVQVNFTTWGWVHLILGIVVVAAGVALMTGRTWGRVAAIVIACVSAIVNLGFLSAYPLWATIMIALDVIVIYAVTAHGRELKAMS